MSILFIIPFVCFRAFDFYSLDFIRCMESSSSGSDVWDGGLKSFHSNWSKPCAGDRWCSFQYCAWPISPPSFNARGTKPVIHQHRRLPRRTVVPYCTVRTRPRLAAASSSLRARMSGDRQTLGLLMLQAMGTQIDCRSGISKRNLTHELEDPLGRARPQEGICNQFCRGIIFCVYSSNSGHGNSFSTSACD